MPTPETPPENDAGAPVAAESKGASNLWTDLGPVVLFVVVYNLAQRWLKPEGADTAAQLAASTQAMYWATGVFMAATLGVIGWMVLKGRKPTPMLLVTAAVVTVFGGLTLILQNEAFILHKPTAINLLFAGLIFGGLLVGKNVWKIAFSHAFDLPDFAWKVFAVRWGFFYVFLAGLNEIILANFSRDFWVNSKIFIVLPVTILFLVINTPYLMKHMTKPD